MRTSLRLLTPLFLVPAIMYGQKISVPQINIGDSAPPMRIKAWLKGTPVETFETGKVYVIEFWATWCRPCIAEIPHLYALANRFKDNVTIISIDVLEGKNTSFNKVQAFVEPMNPPVNYAVAVQDSNFIETEWLAATGEKQLGGIPRAIIVNKEGKLAWMGHPHYDLDDVLNKVVNDRWNIKEALISRNLDIGLRNLEDSLYTELLYAPEGNKRSEQWVKDSALFIINKVSKKQPLIRYTPFIASFTFDFLLKTNMKEAYQFGKKVIVTKTYDGPAYDVILYGINLNSEKLSLSKEIYKLGIQTYEVAINDALSCYPEIRNIYKLYHDQAKLYWQTGNNRKAVETEEKAIANMKTKGNYLESDLTEYESQLQQYKRK